MQTSFLYSSSFQLVCCYSYFPPLSLFWCTVVSGKRFWVDDCASPTQWVAIDYSSTRLAPPLDFFREGGGSVVDPTTRWKVGILPENDTGTLRIATSNFKRFSSSFSLLPQSFSKKAHATKKMNETFLWHHFFLLPGVRFVSFFLLFHHTQKHFPPHPSKLESVASEVGFGLATDFGQGIS